MPALHILEAQERSKIARMGLETAHRAIEQGLYTLAEIAKHNQAVAEFVCKSGLFSETEIKSIRKEAGVIFTKMPVRA